MSYTVGLDMRGFYDARDETMRALTRGIADSVETAAREGAAEAKSVGQFQDRTGNLRGNIRADAVQETALTATWSIVSPMPYSKFVESGTKPHRIEGNPLLKFFWPKVGAWVAFRGVNHPGSKAHSFMGPGMQKAERVLWRELEMTRRKIYGIWQR